MRLLVVTNDFPPKPGGIQQYIGRLVDVLADDVLVLAPADAAAPSDARVVRGHRRFLWPSRRVRRWVTDHVERFEPDAVLFGAPYPLAHLGPCLRAATGVPYAVLCHGAEVTVPAAFPATRQLIRHPLRAADARFAVSRFTAQRVRRLTGRNATYLGAGVDIAVFRPAAVTQPDGIVIGCVSRFVPRKGQRRVLEAAAALRARGRDVTVLLVGGGRDERRLRATAARLGVPTRFEIAVDWDHLPGLYRDMTVFAMPSRSRWMGLEVEGLGLVYLEAAATGLPVIAGDSGGAPETVVPGVTGFVATRPESIVEAVELIIDDATSNASMGAAGRRRVAAEFTWQEVAARLSEALEAVTKG